MASSPKEFATRQELIAELRMEKLSLATHFKSTNCDVEFLVRDAVRGNTARGLRKGKIGPVKAYQEWAYRVVGRPRFTTRLDSIRTQDEYDRWIAGLSGQLRRHWLQRVGSPIPFGPGRKIPDLMLKSIAKWTGINETTRTRLINFLHVPLDKYSLAAIRRCVAEGDPPIKIPRNASMGFVDGEELYAHLQDEFRRVGRAAGCPPIYCDVLVWNQNH